MTLAMLTNVAHHHWLKHPDQTTFHAYPSYKRGVTAVCGDKHPVTNQLNDMEIPGDHTGVCNDCVSALYGLTVLEKVQDHHWLKHDDHKEFHVYTSYETGTHPMCGDPLTMTDWLLGMDGKRETGSVLCRDCFTRLHSFT